jgi:hypothetical protein
MTSPFSWSSTSLPPHLGASRVGRVFENGFDSVSFVDGFLIDRSALIRHRPSLRAQLYHKTPSCGTHCPWLVSTPSATGRMLHLPVKRAVSYDDWRRFPMATLARRLRQRLGVTSMFMLSGLVGTLSGFGWGAPALALEFPPPVQFTNCGQITGAIQTKGMSLAITGTLDYLTSGGQTNLLLEIGGASGKCPPPPGSPPPTSDAWIISTPTAFNEWEVVSADPTTCREKVLPEDSPQCGVWQNPAPNQWDLKCTFSTQGKAATLDAQFTLSGNLVVSWVETTTIKGVPTVAKFSIDAQGSFPPDQSAFNRPSICNAPNVNGDVNEGPVRAGDVCNIIPSVCF